MFPQSGAFHEEGLAVLIRAEVDIRADDQVGFQFLEAAIGCPEKLDEFRWVVASPSLRDVGRNGGGGPTDLGGHAEEFLLREVPCQQIGCPCQRPALFSDFQILVVVDHWAANGEWWMANGEW